MVAPSEPGRRTGVPVGSRSAVDEPALARLAVQHVGDRRRSAAMARLLQQAATVKLDATAVEEGARGFDHDCLVLAADGARAAGQALGSVDATRLPVVVVLPGATAEATAALLTAGAEDVVTVLDPEVIAGVAWRCIWRRRRHADRQLPPARPAASDAGVRGRAPRASAVIDLTADTPPEPVDTERVLRAAVAGLRPLLGEHGATVRILGGFPRLRVDGDELQELLAELLRNAVSHHPRGRPPEIRVRADRHEGGVVLRVEDSGHGIDDMFRLIVLLPGVRVPQPGSSAATQERRGDGLARCASLVVGWGGELELGRSALGGLAVSVALPVGVLAEPALI